MTTTRLTVEEELRHISDTAGLTAENVVGFARDPETSLHDQFSWDDEAVAHRYRLWQARELILRVNVSMDSGNGKEPLSVRAYVSLERDRRTGGGYLPIQQVLTNNELRNELLQDQARALRQAYVSYRERFGAMDEVGDVLKAYLALAKKAEKLSR